MAEVLGMPEVGLLLKLPAGNVVTVGLPRLELALIVAGLGPTLSLWKSFCFRFHKHLLKTTLGRFKHHFFLWQSLDFKDKSLHNLMIFCCLSGVTFINHLNAWAFVTFCFTVYFPIELPTPDCTNFFGDGRKFVKTRRTYSSLSEVSHSTEVHPLLEFLSLSSVSACFPHR